jgi:uncharacterized protein (TIGR02996 family)
MKPSREENAMPSEADLLTAIEREPGDELAWLALADCLEENGQDDRAELVRLREWLRFADLKDPQRPEKEARLGQLLLAGVKPSVPLRTIELPNKLSLTLALIPPGGFWMGGDRSAMNNDERPRHKVTLTEPFYIGVTSVTRAQWWALQDRKSAGPKPSYPVDSVLWAECNKFCKALGKKVGGTFRLPTEAEWEYACRAGTVGGVYLGDPRATLAKAAWYDDNSRNHPHRVGTRKPNAWGLYDMLGNIWDWCADGKRVYTRAAVTDPVGPDGPRRMVKGGAWRSAASRCTASARYAEDAKRETDDQGFRLVMDWS